MKHCNTISTKKQQKYYFYHLEELIKYGFLTGEEILPPDERSAIEKAMFIYSLLGKAFVKKQKRLKGKEKTNRRYYEYKQKISCFNQ